MNFIEPKNGYKINNLDLKTAIETSDTNFYQPSATDLLYNIYINTNDYIEIDNSTNGIRYFRPDISNYIHNGLWWEIGMDSSIILSKYSIGFNTNKATMPKIWNLCGSNDRIIWYNIHNVDNNLVGNDITTADFVDTTSYDINNDYKYFVVVHIFQR